MTKRTKVGWGYIIAVGFIILCALMIVIGISSCNTERIASKQFDRADRNSHKVVATKCSERFPPVIGKDSIYIYKQGEPIVIQDTVTLFDTINNVQTKYVTRTVNTTDTAFKYIRTTEVNRAREIALENTLKETQEQLTKSETQCNWWMWIAIAFGSYSIIRWLVRIIWGFKLP